jgi:methionyl-tRNA synthetase
LEGHKEWKSNVYGQCKSWIDQGLQPRAVTRDLDWGVKVPLPDAEGKVLYVWFDAPIGYISATKEWAEKNGKEWEPYWKSDDSKLVHFIGKDNIVFHCIIFPTMLKAEGSFILPENVPANEFLNLENDKISTSNNWAVWLHEYLQQFPDKQDVLRYVLSANAPETKDNNFTWKDFQDRNNNELLAIFGNFVNRTVVLVHKYFEGNVPTPETWNADDNAVIEEMTLFPNKIAKSIENYRFREALNEMMNLARLGNKYLTDQEPWKKFKTDPERTKTILNLSLQICANLAIVCEPFLPFTAKKLCRILNMEPQTWKEAGNCTLLKAGHQLREAEFLFEKIEDATIEEQIKILEERKKSNALDNHVVTPSKPPVAFEDFAKMDIRVGTIIEAERVPKAKKLLQLKVDTGIDQRTIISGIAEHFEPENIIGQQVSVLVNLAPKELRGVESQGMILMGEDRDGKLVFITPCKTIHNGSEIK